MAYGTYFYYVFESQVSHTTYRIDIKKKDYSGTSYQRALGGTPILKKEKSGGFRGTSLELKLECSVDGEYATLYTSDAREYLVELYAGSTLLWTGFVVPELYSEPDIAPPYDVSVTATDGLGELKRYTYDATGETVFSAIISDILDYTGLSLPIEAVSALKTSAGEVAEFFTGCSINIDFMEGSTLYDVLGSLLETFHATITQERGKWVIIRETDVEYFRSGTAVSTYNIETGAAGTALTISDFGSLASYDIWPVGQMSSDVVPAKKKKTVIQAFNYKPGALTNPNMETDSGWTKTGSVTFNSTDGWYELAAGAEISQAVETSVNGGLRLTIKAGMVPDSSISSRDWADEAHRRLMVKIRVEYKRHGTGAISYVYYDAEQEKLTTEVYNKQVLSDPTAVYAWDAPAFQNITYDFNVKDDRYSDVNGIAVFLKADSDTVSAIAITSVDFAYTSQIKGYKDILLLDNDAREADSDTEIIIEPNTDAKEFQYGLVSADGSLVDEYIVRDLLAEDYLSLIAKDYALSIAVPRLKKSGKLNTPAGFLIPCLMRDSLLIYSVDVYSWELYTDEIDVSLLSLPAASIQVESETVSEWDGTGGSGSYSGGGGTSGSSSANLSDYLTVTRAKSIFDWFISEAVEEENEETTFRLKLNPKYAGMYADGWVSAGGVSEGSGGGGGATLSAVWLSLTTNTDQFANNKIDLGHIPDDERLSYITVGTGVDVTVEDTTGTTGTVLWGAESTTQVALDVNAETKILLKLAALDGPVSRISTLEGYFTGGAAKNSLLLDGQSSAYFATAAGLSSLQTAVSNLVTGVSSVVGATGAVTASQIASALTSGGYTFYTLPAATTSTLGGVIVGSNLSITDGVLSANIPTYNIATQSADGLMSSSDKTKLDGIAAGATNVTEATVTGWGFTKGTGTVTSVKVGDVSYTPTDGVVSLPAYPEAVTEIVTGEGNYIVDVSLVENRLIFTYGTLPTTIALSNVTGADDLKAIEALSGTSGLLRKTAANTWELASSSIAIGSQTVSMGGSYTVADMKSDLDFNWTKVSDTTYTHDENDIIA